MAGDDRLAIRTTLDRPTEYQAEVVTVEGFNFFPDSAGPVRFVPGSDPSNTVELGNTVARTDAQGHFVTELELPNRPSEETQFIRATMRRNVGVPQFTETARITWEKIIETVFLALLATALGTLLAIPLSFFAARNLMRTVRSPLTSIALSILGWPIGLAIGYLVAIVAAFVFFLPIYAAIPLSHPAFAARMWLVSWR